MKRLLFITALIGLVAFGIFLAQKVRARTEQLDAIAKEAEARAAHPERPEPPRIVTPQPGPTSATIRLTGTLRPDAEVDLGFKLPGRVLEVYKQRGDTVRAGEVLARIDTRDLDAQAQQVKASMQAARAQRGIARDAFDRSTKLKEAGAVTEQQVVVAGGQSELTAAGIAQAEAAEKLIEVTRIETRLRAPIAGLLVRAPNSAGFVAAPGMPVYRIEQLGALRFNGHVNEVDAARIQVGAKLTLTTEAGVKAEGTVTLLIGSIDPMTHRVPIEGRVDNPDGKLFAGSFVRAEVAAAAEPTLTVPATALLTGDEPAVLVAGVDGKLARRPIRVATTREGQMFVREGLSGTDRVVADPGTAWRDGDTLPSDALLAH